MKINNRPEVYNKTVNILYNAYFNDTLQHGNACACAVGNIIVANMGITTYTQDIFDEPEFILWNKHIPYWSKFCTFSAIPHDTYNEAIRQVRSTGYSISEIIKIECSFEVCDKGESKEDWMFNGLVNVLATLKEIHGVEEDEEVVEKFTAHHRTKQLV